MMNSEPPIAGRFRQPNPACIPLLDEADIAAVYDTARVGGDYFDFFGSNDSLVFVLMDVAGQREEALDIATTVQDVLRGQLQELFDSEDLNHADGLIKLAIAINTSVLEAARGVRCCPAFLGRYNLTLGTLAYINAGHVPALVRDHESVTELQANGLPFGLFSHVLWEPHFFALELGATLLLASKGLIEAKVRRQELGIDGIKKYLADSPLESARELCQGLIERTKAPAWRPRRIKLFGNANNGNDRTAVALVRLAAQRSSAAHAG